MSSNVQAEEELPSSIIKQKEHLQNMLDKISEDDPGIDEE